MRQSPLDWISRVLMLVLAGMVSLSIIGAIASIPSGSIQGRIGMGPPTTAPASAPDSVAPQTVRPDPPTRGGVEKAWPAAAPETALAPRPPKEPKIAEWLEAITYALLALVGLAALGILTLWCSLAHRRRIAEALDVIAARERI